MLKFLNASADNETVQKLYTLNLDSIKINEIIYVPMIAPIYDTKEAALYRTDTFDWAAL